MFFSSVKVDASKIIFYLVWEQETSNVEMLHQQSVPVIVPFAPGIIGESIYISFAPPPPLGPIYFVFKQVLTKILPNNNFFSINSRVGTSPISPSAKSQIRHLEGFPACLKIYSHAPMLHLAHHRAISELNVLTKFNLIFLKGRKITFHCTQTFSNLTNLLIL